MLKRKAVDLFFVVLAIFLHASAVGASENKVALVFGNSNYQSVPTLNNPTNDAIDIAAALERMGFDVSLQLDVDFLRFNEAVRDYAKRSQNADISVVYFAGHGIEIDKANYLLPVDAELADDLDVELEAVQLRSLLQTVSSTNGITLMLVDACRDNPFATRLRTEGATRSIGEGLVRVDPKSGVLPGGVLIGYAAKEGQYALDGLGRNSPYASALLSNLETPGLEVSKLFRQVRDAVFKETDGVQEPFTYGSLPGRDIYLIAKPETTVEETDEFSSSEIAVAYAATAADGTLAAWNAFLDRFQTAQNYPLVALAAQKRTELIVKQLEQGRAAAEKSVDNQAQSSRDVFTAYTAAEALGSPRAWALFFEQDDTGSLEKGAILLEEQALAKEAHDRIGGRYRVADSNETLGAEQRRSALSALSLTSEEVREFQSLLQLRGNDVGGVDGQIGPKTIQALQAFQKANGLPVTGVPTRATLNELGFFSKRRTPSGLFRTSGAIAKTYDPQTVMILENDPRIENLLVAFKDKQLIYGSFRESIYAVVFVGSTHSEAGVEAMLDAANAKLVEINDADEQEFIFDLVRHDRRIWAHLAGGFRPNHGPTIGLERQSGRWMWRSGEPLTYQKWAPGQPRNIRGDQTFGRLIPVGNYREMAPVLDTFGWATSDAPFSSIIVEIP
ncbi:caspase family protein [Marivita geojedonensis]|uniref:caspase family protein n=1 Tax=Marivita geojedonensis TaxID=1123756 RepID=UPI000A1E35EC|nr:caspase family protein [Marivita geojedonensis]PRY71056.1 putative peptidoglycan binding protein [Marivita geojedonensis]